MVDDGWMDVIRYHDRRQFVIKMAALVISVSPAYVKGTKLKLQASEQHFFNFRQYMLSKRQSNAMKSMYISLLLSWITYWTA